MKLQTRLFGEIEVTEEKIIRFPKGIIAFDEKTKYTVIENEDKSIPFHWLQSLDDGNLAFVIVNPFVFKKDYEFDIPEKVLEELDLKEKEDVAVFSIVVVPEDIKKMTANLAAPIIINTKNLKARQIIINNNKYSTKHLIFADNK